MQNKMMLIIIAVLVVVLIAAAGTFAFFFIRSSKAAKEAEVEPPASAVHLSEEEMTDITLEGGAIKTNLSTSTDGGEHFISVEITVSINNTLKKESPLMIALVTEKQKIVRSIALEVIRKKTYQELKRPDGKEILEDEILTRLQEQFNTNLIVRVAATDLVLS